MICLVSPSSHRLVRPKMGRLGEANGGRYMKKQLAAVAFVVGSLAVPGVAAAQYVSPTTTTQQGTTTTTSAAPTTTVTILESVVGGISEDKLADPQVAGVQEGTLPVTGGDVVGLTALGAGLAAVGLALTRARRRSEA